MADTTPTPSLITRDNGRWLVGNRPGYVYDVEVYPNFFHVTFYDGVDFTTFDQTEIEDLLKFTNDTSKVLIGFNNFAYDDALLRFIASLPESVQPEKIYDMSKLLISGPDMVTPEQRVRRNRYIYNRCDWAFSIDLFEVNNRKAGLKEFECRMGFPTVAESPTDFDKPVCDADIPAIIRYNRNDVLATSKLLETSIQFIDLRRRLTLKYNLSPILYVKSDAKIAEHFMLTMINNSMGSDTQTLRRLALDSPNNLTPSFSISELLPPTVAFRSKEFLDLFHTIKAGRVDRTPKGGWQLVTDMPGNEAYIAGLTLSFGCGGLHSVDEAGIFRENDEYELWDVDVTSFYPGMMIAYGIRPNHVLPVFTTILTDLRDTRVAAKATGDKQTADSLKLIINSLFGKLGDRYSPLRDDRACMQVTIGGQLLLLMLIELVQMAGATVLSANTDGLLLRVSKPSADAVYASLRAWEGITKLSLEEQSYRTVARRDVNNYVAISTKCDKDGRQELKAKGAFNTDATKLSGTIIPLAVQEHLRTGRSIEEIVMAHTRAKDFLFYQRARGIDHFEHGSHRLAKTARWYVTNDENAESILRVDGETKKSTAVPHGHRATLALELREDYTIDDLSGLDYQYYINQTQNLLTGALASVEVDRGTEQARRLQDMGLTLLPTRNGKNPSSVKLDDIETILSLQDKRCETWQVVTGAVTETLVLDLDKPEALAPEIINLLLQNPTLTSWHGEGNANDVRSGRKRGAVTYRYNGEDSRMRSSATKQWAEKHGFEVAYGKKLQTVIGQHRTAGDDYVQEGKLAEAPPELIEYLGLLLGQPRRRKDRTPDPTTDEEVERLRQAADTVLGQGWAKLFQTREGLRGVEGITPGHSSRMRLGVSKSRVWGHTFHTSYDARGMASRIQVEFDRLRPAFGGTSGSTSPDGMPNAVRQDPAVHLDASDIPAPPTGEDRRTAKDCEEAFEKITGIGVIIGTTGTGKTWHATRHAVTRHQAGQRTLLVAPDKEGIEQMRRYVVDHWIKSGGDVKDLRMQVLVSTNVIDDGESGDGLAATSKSDIRDTTLIVLTHHHFSSRKPLTKHMYSILTWVEDNGPEVIIDEIDVYVERQNRHLQLDARYSLIGGDRGHWTRANHCPSVTGSFRCKGCTKRAAGRVVSMGTHAEHQTPYKLLPSQFCTHAPEEFVIDAENLPVGPSIDLPDLNLRLCGLIQTPGYLQQREYAREVKRIKTEDGSEPSPKQEFQSYLRDLIDCSFRPTMAVPLPKDGDGKLVDADPHDEALRLGSDDKPLLDGMKTVKWVFPYFVCHSRFLLLYDRAPMYSLMRNASRIIMMTATLSEMQLEFLRGCADSRTMTVVTIPTPTRVPLDQVVIIGHQERITWTAPLGERAAKAMGCDYSNIGLSNRSTIERLGNALSAAGKPPLVFMPTKEEATSVWNGMKERGWSYYIEGEYRVHSGQAIAETTAIDGSMGLLSYARSSIGTGANMPQYDVIVVDGTVKRPHYLFNPALKTETAYLEAQEADRVRTMAQNVGRILRGEGVKFVFAVGVTPAQLSKLAQEVERLAQTKTAWWFTPNKEAQAMGAIVASVKAGTLVVPEVEDEPSKSRAKQSRKQRAASGEAEGTTPGDTFVSAVETVKAMARDGKTWRAASRAVNASRMPAPLTNILKGFFEAATGRGTVMLETGTVATGSATAGPNPMTALGANAEGIDLRSYSHHADAGEESSSQAEGVEDAKEDDS